MSFKSQISNCNTSQVLRVHKRVGIYAYFLCYGMWTIVQTFIVHSTIVDSFGISLLLHTLVYTPWLLIKIYSKL